ncbi:MAG: flagellar motor switch protein FliG [Opitutaceae bacterium]|nr:flagellar motor switch protein FliG [Opitutaceae bacterium]
MAEPDYARLTRQQKLAVFLICIGPEAAAEVLKQFDDAETERLCREMSAFPLVPEPLRRQAMEEFSGIVSASANATLGGLNYAQRTLEIAKGEHRATTIIGRVGPTDTFVEVVRDVSEMEANQIYNLLKAEQPQTIAFMLSYLDPAKAAQVFAMFSPDLREDVIERLGVIESTPPDLVGKIVRSLGRHLDARSRPAYRNSGGVNAVAGLLQHLDKELGRTLLTRLEEHNATLGTAIRRKLFSFEDLNRLTPADLQRILREVDSANLAIAMKSASEPLRERIYSALSKRAAEGLREEIELLGAVRRKEIESAQDLIIQAVRRLEEEGQVSLDADAESVVA